MLLLSFAFVYTGMIGTFYNGVYGSALGFTTDFGSQAKSMVGLHGIVLGIGETLGGLLFFTFGHRFVRHGREVVVLVGFFLHLISFILIFINLPPDSPYQVISLIRVDDTRLYVRTMLICNRVLRIDTIILFC